MKTIMVKFVFAVGLLAYLTIASAVPAHFPHGKTVIYKYHVDVKAGIIDPSPYASQFSFDGLLYVKHDTTDATLKNAYYVTLDDLKYGLSNGQAMDYQHIINNQNLHDTLRVLQEPFLIVYNEMGKFEGVKIQETETGWSRNMKQAIASMLQLDLSSILTQLPIKSHSFVTREHNIHGICKVAYDVHPKDMVQPESSNTFIVTKFHEPKNCTEFHQSVFDHIECFNCPGGRQEEMTTSSRRVFEIEHQGGNLLIKKLIGQSVINYFPWSHRSEAHYLLTNQTLMYEKNVPVTEVQLPLIEFKSLPISWNVSYNKPQGSYALHAAEDYTQGRHIIKLDLLIPKLKKMLGEAVDYIKENHINIEEPDYKHGQTLNRLLQTMSYMDLASLEQVFHAIQDANTPREITMRNIFLEMIPHVGTVATCHFTRNVIRKRKISDTAAIVMLTKLPRYVRTPTEKLLLEMEDFIKLSDSISLHVRVASILCFATLIDRTYDNMSSAPDRYLQHFYENITKHPSYTMRLAYAKAMGNIRHRRVYELLTPIISGEISVTEHPNRIRLYSILAVTKSLNGHKNTALKLVWPVLANTSLPVHIRTAAYDVLISQLPDMGCLMNIYWFMVYEKNEHLYNYHYTTLKSLANSVNPCMRPIAEMARKILRFSKIKSVSAGLSSQFIVEYVDPKYENGQAVQASMVLNELTGLPVLSKLDTYVSIARKPFHQWGIELYIEGGDALMTEIMGMKQPLTDENVKQILTVAGQDVKNNKDIHIDFVLKFNQKTVLVTHYQKDTIIKLMNDFKDLSKIISDLQNINWQYITYENLYEMHTPTDIGLPAIMGTMIPAMLSVKVKTSSLEMKPNLNLKMQVDIRVWRHGQYYMSIYNPITDTWHAIRKIVTADFALPIDFSLSYIYDSQSMKLVLPRLPLTEHSVVGLVVYAKNYVTVTEDEGDALKTYCPTCQPYAVVTKGAAYKRSHQNIFDSKDTGTKFSSAIFDCETKLTSVTRLMEYYRVFSKNNKNTWDNGIIQALLSGSQIIFNDINSPESGSCGLILKMEPSITQPTSEIEVNVRTNVQDLNEKNSWDALDGKKINLHGTIHVKAASTDKPMRSWDININADISKHHLTNDLKLTMTRITPDEKNLKICLDVQKTYPNHENDDIFKVTSTKEITSGKIALKMGMTDGDNCVRDDIDIVVTFKGEMSDEQKKHIIQEKEGSCMSDAQNPLYQNPQGLIPKTPSCIYEALKHTTLRKYTFNVAYKKVLQDLHHNIYKTENTIRAQLLPHLHFISNYSEAGNVKIMIKYPLFTSDAEVTVITPTYSYKLEELPFGHPVWNLMMDNVHFSVASLASYFIGKLVPCTVHPKVLITPENTTTEIELPTEWTLLSGDHYSHTFSIFAKTVEPSLVAVKFYAASHNVEIIPSATNVIVKVDGNIREDYINGIAVPDGAWKSYDLRISKNHQQIIVQCGTAPVTIIHAMNSVTVIADRFMLRGHVSGMCGRLTDFHLENPSTIHKVTL